MEVKIGDSQNAHVAVPRELIAKPQFPEANALSVLNNPGLWQGYFGVTKY